MKQLEDSQLETFDQEYMYEKRWQVVKSSIDREYPQGDFSFIDVGGGNGMFADRLLAQYPRSRGVVLDNSTLLLNKNVPNDRKRVRCDSAENLDKLDERYDIVFFNWVLHHLVGDGYRQSRRNINQALICARRALTGRGRISIFDNMYDGMVIDFAPSRLIYTLTSSHMLKPITARLGANTAGTGVCFQSKRQWLDTFGHSGLQVIRYTDDDRFPYGLARRLALHMGNVRAGHFWLAPRTGSA